MQGQTRLAVVEATIPQMQAAMANGQLTSRQLVEQYLIRIGLYEDRLNAALAINPRALQEADALDRERAQGRIRGPLHGIPVALKDNIHTTEMPTTGGALAFFGYTPPYEATLTKNLKAAGAIIIAKTGLTELANWVAGNPNAMPGNYNAVGGFAYNPYDPRPDPRPAPGDGRPVLQTGGSIISPSNANMLVGIRPTIGRISRHGVIPITADHDTAGPMTRSVADAAIMLGAMEGASPDPNDPATRTCTPPPNRNYTKFLNASGLKGKRIGVPRAFYIDRVTVPGEANPRPSTSSGRPEPVEGRGGINPEQARVMAEAIAVLKQQGAVVVDPADLPSVVATTANDSFPAFDFCAGAEHAKGKDANCSIPFKYGMKRDFNAWLASLGPSAPVKTLTELRNWNLAHAKGNAIRYQQSRLDISDEMDLVADKARYEADRAKDLRLSREQGIDGVLRMHKLDAFITPGSSGAGVAARAGYPIVAVPFGMVPNSPQQPFPAGFDAKPAPYGVGFVGAQCSEPALIEIAYAFEQATKKRVPPPSAP